jgi:hypothetical protein
VEFGPIHQPWVIHAWISDEHPGEPLHDSRFKVILSKGGQQHLTRVFLVPSRAQIRETLIPQGGKFLCQPLRSILPQSCL